MDKTIDTSGLLFLFCCRCSCSYYCCCTVIFTFCYYYFFLPIPPSPNSEGTSSRFFFESQDRWTHYRHHACARYATSSPMSKLNFLRVQFPSCTFLKQNKKPVMDGMNEKTPESHEHKRQLRLQKQREQSRARLACETKEQRTSEGVKRENVVSKVVLLKKQARKHRSDSKLDGSEIPADVSVKQLNKGLAGC